MDTSRVTMYETHGILSGACVDQNNHIAYNIDHTIALEMADLADVAAVPHALTMAPQVQATSSVQVMEDNQWRKRAPYREKPKPNSNSNPNPNWRQSSLNREKDAW